MRIIERAFSSDMVAPHATSHQSYVLNVASRNGGCLLRDAGHEGPSAGLCWP